MEEGLRIVAKDEEKITEPTLFLQLHQPDKTEFTAVSAVFHELEDLTDDEVVSAMQALPYLFEAHIKGLRNDG